MSKAPLLITVAPNGARRTKADHPQLPISARELAHTAARCRAAGAGMIHLHVRNPSGAHSLAPADYREALSAVRQAAGGDLLVQVTTEACGQHSLLQQMDCVRSLRVEAASFALREYFPGDVIDAQVAEFFAWVWGRGIAAQFILYSPAEIARLENLVVQGIIPQSAPHALFVLGRHAADQQSDPADLEAYLAHWPAAWPWSVCAFGRAELAVMTEAIRRGGHVRVGFENNLEDTDGQLLADNETRVQQVAEIASRLGRPLATAAQVRALFNHQGARVG